MPEIDSKSSVANPASGSRPVLRLPWRGDFTLPPHYGGNDHNRGNASPSLFRLRWGLRLAMAAIAVFFIALCAAQVLSRPSQGTPELPWPSILWLNTAIILGSSICLQSGLRQFQSGKTATARWAWSGAALLGGLFLAGQWRAWGELRQAGYYAATTPGSAFFYLLTVAHAVHIVAGLILLILVAGLLWVGRLRAQSALPGSAAALWHFLDGVWLFLLVWLWFQR